MRARQGWIAVAWAPYSRRSEMFARALGGELRCIHNLRYQWKPAAPFKYVLQAVRTLWMLLRERPAAVYAQDPPFLCPLVVMWYCRVAGACYVVEYHSASFEGAWSWGRRLQRLVARRAAVNIVVNEHWAEIVQSWGGRTLVMYDAFLDLPTGTCYPVATGPCVAFSGSFAEDEPIEAVLAAAAQLPDITFYATGDPRKAGSRLLASAPPNVVFTGFLDLNGNYVGLLRAVDAVLALTTRDHTLQLAGCEAVALGKPLVTTDWPYLRRVFAQGAVFVQPTPEGIRRGVEEAIARADELGAGALALRELRRAEWAEALAELRRRAEPGGHGEPTSVRSLREAV